jgi:RNA polymerase sigma-70 factor, ECF subfamily
MARQDTPPAIKPPGASFVIRMGPVANPQTEKPGSTENIPALLAAAARGDEAAWRDIVQRYARRVFALARSRCQQLDLAEEITQSVFATVAAKLGNGGYTEQGRFESWLFRVAMNRIRDEMRRRKRQAEATDPAVLSGLTREETEHHDSTAMLGKLREALTRLPDADRQVIELRHHAGMSFKEMADLLDEPLGTLLARHHRALRKLKLIIGPSDED